MPSMDDATRQPKDGDRSPLLDRIKQAAEQGRISGADRDIRMGNVRSAQSMAELDLIRRDLDLLDQTFAPGSAPVAQPVAPTAATPTATASVPTSAPAPTPNPWTSVDTSAAMEVASGSAKRVGMVLVVLVLVGVLAAGVIAFFAVNGSEDTTADDPFPPLPSVSATGGTDGPGNEDPADPEDPAGEEPGAEEPAYALDAAGIKAFLSAYQAKFRTTRAVSLTMYGDYVVAQVPQPGGKHRHAGWLYRNGQGWSDFGGVTADFPGSEPIDLSRLDVAALVKNIGRARRTLNVEDQSVTYVNMDYRPQFDDAVNVNIYVSNEFNESGYLATTLDGTVERAYPFAR